MTTHTAEIGHRRGVSLLSFDAGGPRGISQLQILKRIMEELSGDSEDISRDTVKKPCEVFAAIGGTGTGGLIAILLVVLRMTADEALEEFTTLATKAFKDVDENTNRQTQRLKQAILDTLNKHGMNENIPLIPSNGAPPVCKLIVPIMYNNHVGTTCVLNNYVDSQGPPTNLTILEAMLATCATPPLFCPTKISKDFSTFEYVGADIGLSNPVREIIAAAHRTFGDDVAVPCLLSIGCGHPGVTPTPSDSNLSSRVTFLERIAMDSERAAQEIGIQMRKLTLYHRFSVNTGLETSDYRSWKEPEEIATHTTTYLNDREVTDTITRCVNTLGDTVGFTTLEQLRHSGGGETLPPEMLQLTSNYVERKAPMEFIENSIFFEDGVIKVGSKRIIVTGMGGCGKTQLVRKFIETHGERFASVFFVDGTRKGTIKHDLVRYVRSLSAAHSQASFEEAMRFLSLSTQDGERLLIIDNVDDPKLNLPSFLPSWKTGTILITSRNNSHGQLGPTFHLQLDVMSSDEAIELLARSSGRTTLPTRIDGGGAKKVAEELGCLPIALVQAGSYMFTTGCSMEAYISRLRTSRERLLNDPATSQVAMRYQTAFAAFDASYDILPSKAQKTLHLLSFFNRQKFPVDCISLAAEKGFSTEAIHYLERGDEFEDGINCLKEIFYSGEWDPVELDSIVASLQNHSLITVVPAEATRLLYMHPLVHEWGRMRLFKDDARRFQYAAVRLLSCGARHDGYPMLQYLYPHIQALSPVWNDLHVNDVNSFGWILHKSGIYSDCLELLERTLELLKISLDVDDPNINIASAGLAAIYGELGRYDEAEKLQVEVLRQRTALLGIDHSDTTTASANLASTYGRLGRYDEAEKLKVEVLRQSTRLLGIDHPDTILASANLAVTYAQLGRYGEAEKLQVEVLRQSTRLLGIDHPNTIFASANLASTYGQLGCYGEAEKLNVEVLRQRTRLLGIDHPDTIFASANLASTYGQLGRYDEAEKLDVEVLRQSTRLLGIDHPDTIIASANLASTYGRLGRYDEAEKLKVEVLRQRTGLLGIDHPDTIFASENLASTYGQLGRYDEAEKLQVEVLRQRTRLLGIEHPDTISASANLAVIYYSLGRYAEAEALEAKVLARRIALLSDKHPDTLRGMISLAYTYRALQQHSKAFDLAQQARDGISETLGERHPLFQEASDCLTYTKVRARKRDRFLLYMKRIFSQFIFLNISRSLCAHL